MEHQGSSSSMHVSLSDLSSTNEEGHQGFSSSQTSFNIFANFCFCTLFSQSFTTNSMAVQMAKLPAGRAWVQVGFASGSGEVQVLVLAEQRQCLVDLALRDRPSVKKLGTLAPDCLTQSWLQAEGGGVPVLAGRCQSMWTWPL